MDYPGPGQKQKPKVSAQCIQAIERYIYNHKLGPGDKLPSLQNMCRYFGASLTSVREAVKTMELRGELEIRNGSGTYLRDAESPPAQILTDNLSYTRRFGSASEMKKAFIDMLEVRKMIERQVIECVVRTSTDEQLASVGHYLDRLMFNYNNDLPTTDADQVFHEKFYGLCGNRILLELAVSATNMYSWMWSEKDRDIDFLYLDTIPMHEEMFGFVRRRDLRNAKRINDATMDLIFNRLIRV